MMHRSLAADSLVDVLRLIRTPGVGPITFFQLIARYRTATEALAALPELSKRGGRKKPLVAAPREDAEREIERTDSFGAELIVYGADSYPAALTTIEDAPPIMAVKGDLRRFSAQGMAALVGSRNASANSCQFAQKLAREVGAAGIGIASGLARGIDSHAHQASLATGTVAVIAGGIDNIYPPENTSLYHAICEQGAVVSEQPFGQIPFAGAFPSRNRIIAGLSQAVVVVEASPKSGSLITARLALDYNRELLAVPGSPMDARAKGCNQLIKQGAQVVEDGADIVRAVQGVRAARVLREAPAASYESTPASAEEVAGAHPLVLEKLGASAVALDELVEQCHVRAAVVQAVLLELELAGRVLRLPGGRVALRFEDSH